MTDPLLVVAIIGLPSLALLVLLLGFVSYRGMIHYRVRDEAYVRRSVLASGEVGEDAFDLPWIVEELDSPTGSSLKARALPGSAGKLALFHHGIGAGWATMIRYMELFRSWGWTVVAFDSRGHGGAPSRAPGSRAPRPSFGYYEKADLKAVADWAFARFASASFARERFVVFGESMGAATALQYAPLDPRLDAVIADCPYSSATAELEHRLRSAMVPPGLLSLVVLVADAFCRRLEGFSLRDADPSRAILETAMPILFIHGLEDRYVPWRMSVVMAETRRRRLPKAITELLLVPGARHCGSFAADRERYADAIRDFLEASLGRGAGAK
jgi:pimeloyl-ACP methyl ester carboxylesterase